MPQTIVAVAIGQANRQVTIGALPLPSWVRRYINGFVAAFPHNLGTDYVIDYRQCPAAQLGASVFTNQLQADYIICMSTPVVRQAAQAYPAATQMPIIGMVSRPQDEAFSNQANVCGVSAGRSGDAHLAYRRLLDTVNPHLGTATVLNDPNHSPSQDSLADIHAAGHHPNVINVSNPDDVAHAINGANTGTGMLLLPVDWMFGAAPAIIGGASTANVLDFWFVSDWVQANPAPSAFGGYGAPQETCGGYLAQQVDAIWNGGWPNPVWLSVQHQDRVWMTSQTRAANANVQLNPNNPPAGPAKVP